MKRLLTIIILFIGIIQFMYFQNTESRDATISYHINENVKNSEEDYFVEIYSMWQEFLNSNAFVRADSKYWDHDEYQYPDYGYLSLLMDIRKKIYYGEKIQCSVVGIVPAKKDYFLIKSVFTEKIDSSDLVDVKYITSTYAKKNGDKYVFFSSTQYQKEICQNEVSGKINYIIHPEHKFDKKAAMHMEKVNVEIAEEFEIAPLSFDYVVANDSRDLGDMMGVHLFEYSYQPVASGGMADTYNNIIYAGNNSEYYPHEVVHLYTSARFSRQYHHWVDEGIAALLGGSTGYDIEWHWEKLRRFVVENPDYIMDDLTELQKHIPNGEFITDFRYAIGALICQKIIDKEGMQGVFEALQAGRSEDDYFNMVEEKLDVNRANFGTYVKAEILKMEAISDEDLKSYKY
ncbi:hypothetical protein N9B82_04595 [Saprospiraceae bacterium]|nr:hypothetical protein [Saprospiraceae bacterium]